MRIYFLDADKQKQHKQEHFCEQEFQDSQNWTTKRKSDLNLCKCCFSHTL